LCFFLRMCCQSCFPKIHDWQHILGKKMIGSIFWKKTWLAAHSGKICCHVCFFTRMCCQSCFSPECAVNHVFPPKRLLIRLFSQNVLPIMFSLHNFLPTIFFPRMSC
jgi:hypothetical protein